MQAPRDIEVLAIEYDANDWHQLYVDNTGLPFDDMNLASLVLRAIELQKILIAVSELPAYQRTAFTIAGVGDVVAAIVRDKAKEEAKEEVETYSADELIAKHHTIVFNVDHASVHFLLREKQTFRRLATGRWQRVGDSDE